LVGRGDAIGRVRLIAVDLDGTLLAGDSTLSPAGARALSAAAERGVRVILSTTRTPPSVRAFAREMGLGDPLICTNGAEIWASADGPVWAKRPLSDEFAWAVAELADERGWSLITSAGEVSYYRQASGQAPGPPGQAPGPPGQAPGPPGPYRAVVARNVEALRNGPVTRILNYESEAIRELRALCERRYRDQCHVETYYHLDGRLKSIGLFAPGADKGTALTLVMDRLGIGTEGVMAVGDNPNDLPMFACARIKVAMGNATPDVKEAATLIAPPHDEEGVAWAVARCVKL
jgi:hydroxymethylpyrimidine pyrophosphatase-like HAD family hydrolase